jgi:hypothetical protein
LDLEKGIPKGFKVPRLRVPRRIMKNIGNKLKIGLYIFIFITPILARISLGPDRGLGLLGSFANFGVWYLAIEGSLWLIKKVVKFAKR